MHKLIIQILFCKWNISNANINSLCLIVFWNAAFKDTSFSAKCLSNTSVQMIPFPQAQLLSGYYWTNVFYRIEKSEALCERNFWKCAWTILEYAQWILSKHLKFLCCCLEPALHYLLRAVTLNFLLGTGLLACKACAWCLWEKFPAEQSLITDSPKR